jgi:hypothetical protein
MARSAFPERPSGTVAPMLRWFGVTIVAGALLAAVGPFGTYVNGGFIQRAGYWIAGMLLGLVLYGSALKIVTKLIPSGHPMWWPSLIGAALLASVPEAMATRAGAFWLWPELAQLRLPLLQWFAQTAMIGLLAMLGAAFVLRRFAPTRQHKPVASVPFATDTVSLGGDVLALQMEDHYVRAHRPNGSDLIHMPLGRAIGRVEVEGLQTHRSWWVARHAVVSVEGSARSMRLHLSNGLVAPVARSAVIHLKAAGWFSLQESDDSFQE